MNQEKNNLASLVDAFENQPTTSRAILDTEFVYTTGHDYTHNGEKIRHEFECVWIVVDINETGITCERVTVVDERNRPTSFVSGEAPHTLRLSHYAVETYSDNGDIYWLEG